MCNRTHGQWDTWAKGYRVILKIEMGYLEGWGTWAIGHMIIMWANKYCG